MIVAVESLIARRFLVSIYDSLFVNRMLQRGNKLLKLKYEKKIHMFTLKHSLQSNVHPLFRNCLTVSKEFKTISSSLLAKRNEKCKLKMLSAIVIKLFYILSIER